MARASVIARARKRVAMVERYRERRERLLQMLRDSSLSEEQRRSARNQLQKLPRDASPVRVRNRCQLTGRPNGVYRKFGLCRNKLREAAMRGEVPGLVKASW